MDSAISWFILDVVAIIAAVRFLIYVLDQHEKDKEEKRDDGKW